MRNQTQQTSGKRLWKRSWFALLLLTLLVPTSGCISFAANLLYAIRGNDMPAEYAD